jgi:hypothetical protein
VSGAQLHAPHHVGVSGDQEAHGTVPREDAATTAPRWRILPPAGGVDKEKGEEMEFQDAKRVLKTVYGNFDSDSGDNERRKALHAMFGGSWDITSRRIIKTLRREIAVAAPAPRAAPHHKWMETSIGFDASDRPKNMMGAR